ELLRHLLGARRGADRREEAVRLAELSLAPLRVAALACQLGELDVDQRLERLRARVARQLERPCERRLDFRTRGGAGRAEQDPRPRQARICPTGTVPARLRDLDPLGDQGARPLQIAEAEVRLTEQREAPSVVLGVATLPRDRQRAFERL